METSISQQLPPGWECFYSKEAERHYFVDHIGRSTQWEDPRLTHPFLWGDQENKKLKHLKEKYDVMPEEMLREALLRNSFDVQKVVDDLKLNRMATADVNSPSTLDKQRLASDRDAGGQEPQRPKEGSSVALAGGFADRDIRHRASSPSGPASGDDGRRQRSDVDEFAYMALKSKFSELPDPVICDALSRCKNDAKKAAQELRGSGYDVSSRRQAAADRAHRIEMDDAEMIKQKISKKLQVISQLCSEFPMFSEQEISEIYEKSGDDLTEARSLLRQKETKQKIDQMIHSNKAFLKNDGTRKLENLTPQAHFVDQFVQQNPEIEKLLQSRGLRVDSNKQATSDRLDEAGEAEKLKLLRKTEVISQLRTEFSSFSDQEIAEIYAKADEDASKARLLLRETEAKSRADSTTLAKRHSARSAGGRAAENEEIRGSSGQHRIELDDGEKVKMKLLKKAECVAQLLSEFPSFTQREINEIFDKSGADLTEARVSLRNKESKLKAKQIKIEQKSIDGQRSRSEAASDPPSGAASKSVPIVRVESDSVVGLSGLINIAKTKTDYLGADSSLRKKEAERNLRTSLAVGPDKSLLQKKGDPLAKGCDKTIRHGPNPNLLQIASFKKYAAMTSS